MNSEGRSQNAEVKPVARNGCNLKIRTKQFCILEEADETVFWLELLSDSKIVKREAAGFGEGSERINFHLRNFNANGKGRYFCIVTSYFCNRSYTPRYNRCG